MSGTMKINKAERALGHLLLCANSADNALRERDGLDRVVEFLRDVKKWADIAERDLLENPELDRYAKRAPAQADNREPDKREIDERTAEVVEETGREITAAVAPEVGGEPIPGMFRKRGRG